MRAAVWGLALVLLMSVAVLSVGCAAVQPRVVVHLQTNAVAFSKWTDAAIIAHCRERPQRNASWHWWGKATGYKPSPDSPDALRILIGMDWSDPHAGWMEYRAVDGFPVLEKGHL